MKAVGQFAGGIAAYDAGKYTRSVMKMNASQARQEGVAEGDRIRTESRLVMGNQLVGQGGSGMGMGTGSALDALRETAIARELDIATVRRKSLLDARGFKQQGDLAYAQGKSARAAGFLSGAASLAESVSSAFTGGASGAAAGGGA